VQPPLALLKVQTLPENGPMECGPSGAFLLGNVGRATHSPMRPQPLRVHLLSFRAQQHLHWSLLIPGKVGCHVLSLERRILCGMQR